MRFIQNKDLGFDREKILLITLNDSAVFNNLNAFTEEIKRHPAVEETALSFTAPGRNHGKSGHHDRRQSWRNAGDDL